MMPVAVVPGNQVCIIVKSNIPSNASIGAQDVITVTATFVPSVGPTTTLSRVDITTVGSPSGSGLALTKSVRNVTQGGSAGITNTARPADVLEYVITYRNTSSVGINTIVINDVVPAFTGFNSAGCGMPFPLMISACMLSIQPAFNAGGAIQWTLTGTLLPGQSGNVFFLVTVN
jgi:mucin-19